MSGHKNWVNGALVVPDGRFLSWSYDNTLRLWRSDGTPDAEPLRGHEGWVNGALALPDGRFLSWGMDKTLRLWRSDGTPDAEPLRRHKDFVKDALVLPDNRIVSFDDRMICAWSPDGGLLSAIPVDADIVLCNEKAVVTARDGRLVVYDLDLG